LYDLKLSLARIYEDFKYAHSKKRCLVLYIIATFIAIVYFTIIISLIPFVFIYIILTFIYVVIYKKNKLTIYDIIFYKFSPKNNYVGLIKFYVYDLSVYYSYLVLYSIIKIVKTKNYIAFLKEILARIINILFIIIFGYPSFLLNIIWKLAGRMNNGFSKGKFRKGLFIIHLNSMYMYDIHDHTYAELIEIYYESGEIKTTNW